MKEKKIALPAFCYKYGVEFQLKARIKFWGQYLAGKSYSQK